ncbi:Sir2 family NAD-dependent protein deacetylase [Paenibacillus sediminis]|uniref:protein acetyllysine N-acetyltransferase n=1 Tax=Paenibacillus sediminis TaxID=664909 RepID=A0ABS4H6E8_9BACL|nr:Sir2 family NAD-dependent protein deacetylase [Paenibacillus sediminis]MBP1938113.1 NAD-dependent SIR2 family protein deacetylase [Paenibacillus sediminis]
MKLDEYINRHRDVLNEAVDQFKRADRILIGAGAGLSAAAGIDYYDTEMFKKLFPSLVRKGFTHQYQLVGYHDWTPEQDWAYYAVHINHFRYQVPPSPIYKALYHILKNKDYFVMTSNVDGMFYRTGFDTQRIFAPQGAYDQMKCIHSCTEETWDIRPTLDILLQHIDHDRLEVKDPRLLPRCAYCGGLLVPNIRGGYRQSKHYAEMVNRLNEWLHSSLNMNLLVMELGAGLHTPIVIRWPMEKLTHQHPRATLFRVNDHKAEVPERIRHKSITMAANAGNVIYAMKKLLNSKQKQSSLR